MQKKRDLGISFLFCQNEIFFLKSAFPNIALQTLLLYLRYLVKHKKLKTIGSINPILTYFYQLADQNFQNWRPQVKEGSRMEGTLDVDFFNLGGSF